MALQDEYIKTALRLPPDTHARVHQAADAAGRSFNAELIARIQSSFDQEPIAERLDRIEALLNQLLRKAK